MPEFGFLHVTDYIKPAPEVGPDVWRATTDAWGYSAGQFVAGGDVAQVKGMVRWQNRVRGHASAIDAASFTDARESYQENIESLEAAQTEDERIQVRQAFSP